MQTIQSTHTKATLIERFLQHAIERPSAEAFTFLHTEGSQDRCTYAELEQRTRALALALKQRGATGERALLLYPSGLNFIIAFVACLRAGVIAVPATLPRGNKAIQRLIGVSRDAKTSLILTLESLSSQIEEMTKSSSEEIKILATDIIPEVTPMATLPLVKLSDIAFLQYTSGSTGAPKGVIVTHENLAANIECMTVGYEFSTKDVIVSWLPLFHDMGLVGNVLLPLAVGFPSVLMAPEDFLREPARWLRAITKYRATCAGGPNFGWDHCARFVSEEQKRGLDLSSLEVAFSGAEPVRATTFTRFEEAFSSCGFQPGAWAPCYGMAETTLFISGGPRMRQASILAVDEDLLAQGKINIDTSSKSSLVGCGRSWLDTHVAIVDPKTGRACEPGLVGEIWVSGASVSPGYWNKPEETAANLKATLPGRDGRFLRTGDLGFLLGKELFITGRSKDLIIVRGRNIYPQDIERAIEDKLGWVRPNTCAAFSLRDEESEALGILIEVPRSLVEKFLSSGEELASGIEPILQSLRGALVEEFEADVSALALCAPGSFPRTTSGKVQRSTARDMLRQSSAIVYVSRGAQLSSTKRRPGAERLIHDWLVRWLTKEKGAQVTTLDVHTPLTQFGIDSVGMARLGAMLEKEIKSSVRLEDIFQCQTIHKLARFIEEATMPRAKEDPMARYRAANERIDRWIKSDRYFFHPVLSAQSARDVVTSDRRMLMMSSYSYLGLMDHPEVVEATVKAARFYGTGAHAARLLSGTTELHRQLSVKIASFVQAEDAMVFTSGYVANLSTIAALVKEGDVVIGDELNHASLHDGCQGSGATCWVYKHNDMRALESLLQQANGRHTLVVVDAVFSMEGDIVDLPAVFVLCRRYGALLMVDEAHSLGVLGKTGRGVLEHFWMPADSIDIKMGTLSKAIPSAGGYIAGSRQLIKYLSHHARGYVFSGALPAPQVSAALAAFEVLEREPQRVERLWLLRERYARGLKELGFDVLGSQTPIVPILCKTEEQALEMTHELRQAGVFVSPVFYPAVPMNAPRLRTCVLSSHTEQDIDLALAEIEKAARKVGLLPSKAIAVSACEPSST